MTALRIDTENLNNDRQYEKFLSSKAIRTVASGIGVSNSQINPLLFPFQRDVVKWACRKGRAAIFLDTGLGKTFVSLEWARLVGERTLIVAPLSVARQTVRMAGEIDLIVRYVRHQSEVDEFPDDKLFITNYEMVEEFDPSRFGAVILDESSILKALDGKTRRKLTDMFADTPYRLCCTATPAPNDRSEIGNHAEFLGVCKMSEMLAMFFVNANKQDEIAVDLGNGNRGIMRTKHSNKEGQEWRLRNHGKQAFYRWLSSWAMSLRLPSDLGYNDDGFVLPALSIKPIFVDVDYRPDDQLFFTRLKGVQDRHNVRRGTLEARLEVMAGIVNGSDEQFIVWCGLNQESAAAHEAVPDSVEVIGSDSPEQKAELIEAFQDGRHRVLVTKGRIAGFGMNFQNSHQMVFLGLSDSWEMYYQCIRREWRFGQQHPVTATIVLSEAEREIYDNVIKKELVAREMASELIKNVRLFEEEELGMLSVSGEVYREDTARGDGWTAMLGDSCRRLSEIADNSVDLSVYSPPFADLYTYSNSDRDLGNSRDWSEFFEHYRFIISEMLRVTKPGRLTCVHVADIPAMSMKDGYIGMRDFPGEVVRAYEREGWTFVGRAIVAKNPQAQAIRTKAKALLFTQLRKDSSESRPAILDQILLFKRPGNNVVPIVPVANGEMDNETWIDWAGGIWTGIQESDTLQFTTARDRDDEKHICPLQLGTIERCIKLYSNPGETVLTPFMGIGSEIYQAIRFGRKGIGIELKESYWKVAIRNLQSAERENKTEDLFSQAGIEV